MMNMLIPEQQAAMQMAAMQMAAQLAPGVVTMLIEQGRIPLGGRVLLRVAHPRLSPEELFAVYTQGVTNILHVQSLTEPAAQRIENEDRATTGQEGVPGFGVWLAEQTMVPLSSAIVGFHFSEPGAEEVAPPPQIEIARSIPPVTLQNNPRTPRT